MLSFIVPAHDEETLIGATLRAIRRAGDAAGRSYEVIVVDDGSTDGTAAIAAAEGARVVSVQARHISKARNAGAAVASGETFIFVDADTLITPEVVAATVRAIAAGAIAGGSATRLDDASPRYGKVIMWFSWQAGRWLRLASGCYLYCTRLAFERSGGFDEHLYVGEELVLSRALHAHGRFVMLREHVVTSGRKMRTHSFGEIMGMMLRMARRGPGVVRSRERLELWYGPRRRDK
jgi:glycosyltransferase involved in cell wall biosynthesis